MLPRHRTLALGGEIDDDLRLLAIEQFEQQIELVGDVIGVIFVALPLVDVQRERLGPQQVASDPHHQFRIGMIEQIERGMNPERSAAAQYRVSLTHQKFPRTSVLADANHSMIVQS